jgi:hypothetical protein
MSDSEDNCATQTVNTPTKRKRHVILSDSEEEPATREVPFRQLPPRDEPGEPLPTGQPTRACAPAPTALVRGRRVDFVVGANVIVWYIMDEKCPDKKTAFSGKVLSYLPQQRGQQRHGLKVYFEEEAASYWIDEDGVDEWCWQEELEEIEATLPAEERQPGEVVPVRLHAAVTEVGTLRLEAVSRTGTETWKIEFDVRGGD